MNATHIAQHVAGSRCEINSDYYISISVKELTVAIWFIKEL